MGKTSGSFQLFWGRFAVLYGTSYEIIRFATAILLIK